MAISTSSGRAVSVAALIVILVVAVMIFALPFMRTADAQAGVQKCQRNMRTLGELLKQITDPRKLPTNRQIKEDFCIALVFRNLHDAPAVLICPATKDKIDENWSNAKQAPKFRTKPNNCSYFGPIDTATFMSVLNAASNEAVAGEHWFNHPDGVNVLFGDCHVTWYSWDDFELKQPEDVWGRNWEDTTSKLDLTEIGGSGSAEFSGKADATDTPYPEGADERAVDILQIVEDRYYAAGKQNIASFEYSASGRLLTGDAEPVELSGKVARGKSSGEVSFTPASELDTPLGDMLSDWMGDCAVKGFPLFDIVDISNYDVLKGYTGEDSFVLCGFEENAVLPDGFFIFGSRFEIKAAKIATDGLGITAKFETEIKGDTVFLKGVEIGMVEKGGDAEYDLRITADVKYVGIKGFYFVSEVTCSILSNRDIMTGEEGQVQYNLSLKNSGFIIDGKLVEKVD